MNLKRSYAIPLVIVIGVVTLFVFPEPASNLIAYLLTMLVFGVLIALTVRWSKRARSA
jgi:hypothetical protein